MSLQPWQRANILAAVNYLRDLINVRGGDPRADALCLGLFEVLEPTRRTARLQREGAQAAKAAAVTGYERRAGMERRIVGDRRRRNVGRPAGERRSGRDRRSGGDRRSTS